MRVTPQDSSPLSVFRKRFFAAGIAAAGGNARSKKRREPPQAARDEASEYMRKGSWCYDEYSGTRCACCTFTAVAGAVGVAAAGTTARTHVRTADSLSESGECIAGAAGSQAAL